MPSTRARVVARTELLLVAGLLGLVGLAWLAERVFSPDLPVHLGELPALALCAVPALLWLGYFYLQDRHEPEPKEYVLGVYLLGAFVSFPLARFATGLWPVAPFGGGLAPHAIFLAIIPGGLAQELAKYVVVRSSVYLSDEFDEPMDGIVYMMAAGIGFATASNWQALRASGGTVFLAAGTMDIVIATLAHGCFAGVLGYALGIARWSGAARRGPLLLIGLFVAAALSGVFGLLDDQVRVTGMTVEPWRGVAFAALFAAVVFGATNVLMRRHLAASPLNPEAAGATAPGPASLPPVIREPFWLRHDLHVVGAAVLVLATAWALRGGLLAPPEKRVAHGRLSASVPASWMAAPPAGDTTAVRGEDGVTGLELQVTERPGGLVSLDAALELERVRRTGDLYQRLESGRRRLGGREVLRTLYAYAVKPTPTHAPRVATAIEYAFPIDGTAGPLFVATLHGGEERLRDLEPQILGSLEVGP